MRLKHISILLLFFCNSHLISGEIHGIITHSETGQVMPDVSVNIEGLGITARTNVDGQYVLEGVPAGKYYLVFMATSCYALVVPDVKIGEQSVIVKDIRMYPGNENELLFLEIGGIKVTTERELINNQPETVWHISPGDIEHMQANSLADILDRLPGIERKNNLGLARQQVLPLRGFDNEGDDQAALFGTKVIIDDIPLNNNTDLNTGLGVGYGTKVTKLVNGGSQYDLREIVAENIKQIEVIPGAASVEYGDHSQGLILVNTRIKNVPNRFKIKSNPDTKEANLMGGFNIGKTNLVYNLNYGYSERDIRMQGDEYHRINVQLDTDNFFEGNKLNLRQRLIYGRKIEEDNDDSDPDRTRAYNRDHHIVYAHTLLYNLNKSSSFYIRNYINYRRRNSWLNKLESTDMAYLTDRISPGTREGIVSQPYYRSDVRTTGDEWSIGSKLKYTVQKISNNFLHRILTGATFNWEKNYGSGKLFDILLPPNGRMGIRPRSFDDIPKLLHFALFFEDRITGKLLKPFTANLGLRIDSYNPTSTSFTKLIEGKDFFQASQGTFINPRLGIQFKIRPNLQARFNYSKSSKIPALSVIFPEHFYLDVYDRTIKTITGPGGEKDSNITLVSTYLREQYVPHLKGYETQKWEAAIDYQWHLMGFSLLGYYQRSDGIPQYVKQPFIYSSYFWPNWPSSTGKIEENTITTTNNEYKLSSNLKWILDRGIEFEFRTHRIKPLNMIFRMNAAYKHRLYGSKNYKIYGNTRVYNKGDTLTTGWIAPMDMQVIPYYKPCESWKQQMIVNYFVDYVYQPLGIWFTFKAQQVLLEKSLDVKDPDISAQGYFFNNEFYSTDTHTSYLMELDREFSELSTTVDGARAHVKWLFGVVVSKSLFSGADVSIFVENILNDRAHYADRAGNYYTRNPEIFWGVAFSSKLDELFE